MLVRIEFGTGFWIDLDDLVAFQSALELLQRGFRAFAELFPGGFFQRQTGFKAVEHRQQAFGEAFKGKLARLGDFIVGAATGVLSVCLGAQIVVGQFGVFGLQNGQLGLRFVRLIHGVELVGGLRRFKFFRAGCACQGLVVLGLFILGHSGRNF